MQDGDHLLKYAIYRSNKAEPFTLSACDMTLLELAKKGWNLIAEEKIKVYIDMADIFQKGKRRI